MRTPTPQRFGPYVIIDRIGDGGMAEIFLAKMQGYSGFEKLVALKKIHPRYSQNQTFARMLIHEAKLAATLNHFNVVQVHDLGEIQGQVYIAMEYVHGKDLAAVLSNTYRRKERLPIDLALCVATDFVTGLDYAHRVRSPDGDALGIIHRDISPQNVLISNEGEVKLTDFGIARVLSEKNTDFRLPGNLHGKFGYMSPEQVRGQEIDQRSDIFSSGVVLWEMLTGRRLFRGKEHKETIKMIVSLAIPLPSSLNADVPVTVDRICMKALAREPDARYQTTGALLGELSRAADELPRRAATRDLSVYMRRQFGPGVPGFGSFRSKPGRTDRPSVSAKPEGVQVSTFTRTTGDRVALGQLLMEQGSLSAEDLEIALAEQRAGGGRIGELLVASGTVSEDSLVRALSTQANLPTISEADLLEMPPPVALLQRFPKEAAEATLILPISINEAQRSVGLAVNDPYDERAILETKVVLGVNEIVTFVAKRTAIRAAIETWYPADIEEPEAVPESPVFNEPAEVEEEAGPPVVLIADADAELAEALATRVREEDCQVVVATDGKTARDYCRDLRPTVAFLDASLPGIDGYNLLLELRSKSEDAAVFLTSARGEEFRQAKALELGADDFVVKPYSVEIMTSKIRREIRRRSEGRKVQAPAVQFDGVSGSLKDMTGLDIVQSLELGRKTAHVVLQYEDGRSGELRIDQGRVAGCVMGDQIGEASFFALTRPGDGLFRIEYRPSSIANNIRRPNTYLMIEAMRRIDEQFTPAKGTRMPPRPKQQGVRSAESPRPPPLPPSRTAAAPKSPGPTVAARAPAQRASPVGAHHRPANVAPKAPSRRKGPPPAPVEPTARPNPTAARPGAATTASQPTPGSKAAGRPAPGQPMTGLPAPQRRSSSADVRPRPERPANAPAPATKIVPDLHAPQPAARLRRTKEELAADLVLEAPRRPPGPLPIKLDANPSPVSYDPTEDDDTDIGQVPPRLRSKARTSKVGRVPLRQVNPPFDESVEDAGGFTEHSPTTS